MKIFVQHLHKVVYGLRMARRSKLKRIIIGRPPHLEVIEIVVTDVYADAEVQTSIPSTIIMRFYVYLLSCFFDGLKKSKGKDNKFIQAFILPVPHHIRKSKLRAV